MLESKFQSKLIKQIEERFPGAVVLKTDPTHIRSIPDRIVLYKDFWAALETKRSEDASKRPNQAYYVNLLDEMSFARFVNPQNKEEVMYELGNWFEG